MAKFNLNQVIPINHEGKVVNAIVVKRVKVENLDKDESAIYYDYKFENENYTVLQGHYHFTDIKESILEHRNELGLRILNGETFPME